MADFRARQRVQIHDGTNEFGVVSTQPIFVNLSDGTDTLDITAGGALTVETNLGKAEDSIHTSGDTGVMALAVRQDVQVDFGADGDYVPLSIDDSGNLRVTAGAFNGPSNTDDSAFTIATDAVSPSGFLADETTPDSVDEGDVGLARMTLDRKILTRVVGAADGNRLDIDASGHAQVDLAAVSVTAVPVSATTAANTELNPLFVQVVSTVTSGQEVQDYDTTAAVAKDGTDNHDYTVTGTTFLLRSIIVSSSGSMKTELQTGPVASLTTKAVIFTSGSSPTEQINFNPPIEVTGTTPTVRLIRRNDDNNAMDVYSTIIGSDV